MQKDVYSPLHPKDFASLFPWKSYGTSIKTCSVGPCQLYVLQQETGPDPRAPLRYPFSRYPYIMASRARLMDVAQVKGYLRESEVGFHAEVDVGTVSRTVFWGFASYPLDSSNVFPPRQRSAEAHSEPITSRSRRKLKRLHHRINILGSHAASRRWNPYNRSLATTRMPCATGNSIRKLAWPRLRHRDGWRVPSRARCSLA